MTTQIPSIEGPPTPQRKVRSSVDKSNTEDPQAGMSPSAGSNTDSGVGDIFDSPLTFKDGIMSSLSLHGTFSGSDALTEVQEKDAQKDSPDHSLGQEPLKKLMPENPFESEHSRILFEAIDKLQSLGSMRDFNIELPELIIVGGQSAGKSSLLESLTDIPFPVGAGCCTRFPTRIVSRRSPPGSRPKFHISIEKPEVDITGLQPPSEKAFSYAHGGDKLGLDDFIRIMDEISSDYMCIRKGKGNDKKNFTAAVLRIEMSGPDRSHFSILDLPGIFQNSDRVNKSDKDVVKKLIRAYMKRPSNIVLQVQALSSVVGDLANQEIFEMAETHIQQQQFVRVFTKCDILEHMPEQLRDVIAIASGMSENAKKTKTGSWFLVRNHTQNDSENFDLQAGEEALFQNAHWGALSPDRLGTAALKTHLGNLLDAKIRTSFPAIQDRIKTQLNAKTVDLANLGEPREEYQLKQTYLSNILRQYADIAQRVLERPGDWGDSVVEVRREISQLNKEFDTFMRAKGVAWAFGDNFDPQTELHRIVQGNQTAAEARKDETDPKTMEHLEQVFPNCSHVGKVEELRDIICEKLIALQGASLPGVINPEVYPVMYRLQVSKWTKITEIHLRRVREVIKRCFESILAQVCPPSGSTLQLHRRLAEDLMLKFEEAYSKAEERCLEECRREATRDKTLTSDPRFETELLDWRRLRFWSRYELMKGHSQVDLRTVIQFYDFAHATVEQNMLVEIHDIVKVYYKLSLENFIRNITNHYTDGFMSDPEGPIKWLNTEYILRLSTQEVEDLASEDKATLKRRRQLEAEINKLRDAQRIAEEASSQTADLGAE